MKNVFVTGLFLLAQCVAFAQQSVLNGTVTVFNSQFETGKKQYVANAQVEGDYDKSQTTTTNTEGVFKLPLVGINDLDKVFFNVKKADYEVVNTDALQAVAGQKDSVQVYLALEGVLAENKRKYYQINRTASEKAVTEKLVQLGKQIETLQQNKEANQSKIETLQTEYGHLQESFKKIDETAKELAERYAKTNLDDASAEYQRAFRYFQRGLLDSALFVFQKMDLEQTAQFVVSEQNRTAALKTEYETRNTEKNKQKMQTTEALQFKANLHQTQFEFSRVEECYTLLLRLDSTNINTLWNYAYFLANQRFDKKSIFLYEKALLIAQTDETKAIFQNNLGELYRINQQMSQAEVIFNDALKSYQILANKKPNVFLPYVASVFNNLGNYYSDNQKMTEAEATFNDALKIYRLLADKEPDAFLPDVAMTLNNLGIYYYANQKIPQAEASYNEALKIYQLLVDKNIDIFVIDVTTTLNNLGLLYRDNQQMPQAETALNEALRINKLLANKNPDAFLHNVAMTLINLGNYYYANQQMPQAEATFSEALKLYRLLAEKNPDAFLLYVAATLNNLGNYYISTKKMLQAEESLNEALKLYRLLAIKDQGVFLPNVAMALNNIGIYYRDIKKMTEAETALNEALKIRRNLADKNPDAFLPAVASTLNNLGNTCSANQKMIEAEAEYAEALKIYRQLADKNSDAFLPYVASTLNNLGVFYKTLRHYNKALQHYGEAMAIQEDAILEGSIHQFKNWTTMLRNVLEVRDSAQMQKEYINVVKSEQLITVGCDKLKKVNEKLLLITVRELKLLSWWALFTKDYVLSEKSVHDCLELDKTQVSVLSNLGHSQLLRGQYSAALVTYTQLKDTKNKEGKDYKQMILNDFKALEAEGITHKDMPRMKAEIEKW